MAKKRHAVKKTHSRKKHKYPKKPKKPRVSATAKTWIHFDEKMKHWEARCREIDAQKKRKESIINKYLHY